MISVALSLPLFHSFQLRWYSSLSLSLSLSPSLSVSLSLSPSLPLSLALACSRSLSLALFLSISSFSRQTVAALSSMRWLRLVGSLKLQVSFAKEPYKRDDILQKRPIILRSLLTEATPYSHFHLPTGCQYSHFPTGYQRPIGCLICMGHFPHKSSIISGSFVERDLQLKASYICLPPCMTPRTTVSSFFLTQK